MSDRNTDTRRMDSQRFELLVDAITDYAIHMLDVDGRIASWNSGAQRFKGYSDTEIIGEHFSRFFTDQDRARGLPQIALKTAAEEGRFETEGWRVRKDGSQFWANAIIDAIRDEQGRLIGFAKITRDITARKEADEALRQSEQRFRLLLQGVTDYALFMLDRDGHVSNWNTGAARIKGYTEDEIVGSHFSRFYTDEDRQDGLPERALSTARTEGRFEHEGWRLRKDGSRFFAHVVIDPIFDADGELAGYAKITRDITERRAAADALKRTEQALQQAQKMESIGKLTGGVAHDFNNLLQIISGNLQLLGAGLAGNESAQHRINAALEGVQRGAKLASYLLAFGRRQALDPKTVNVGRFLPAMTDLLRRALGETVDMETVVGAGLWNTFIDVGQLENALLNLSINARDAMPEGGRLTIEIGNAFLDDVYAREHADVAPGQYIMLAVTDTGTGMSPETIRQAFEPFFSTKPEGKGSGLGLSMVYGFVKQSGGHIKIYSEIGLGTTIKLYLPRSLMSEEILQPAAETIVLGGSETILVAEDDPKLCDTVIEMLRSLGYQVLKAGDAAGALAIIDSGIKIDLLFTDVVMPGSLRSPELAQRAKALLPNLAVLFTSGYTQNAIVHGGRLDPGVELLPKPYTRDALARKVRHVLANQKHLQELRNEVARLSATDRVNMAGRSSLKILLLEDDRAICATTQEILEQMGHSVVAALDTSEGLTALQQLRFDVLITDVGLGEASGVDFAEQARAIQPGIGVVYATGLSQPVDLAEAKLLQKPYDMEKLRTVLSLFEPLHS